MLNQRVYFHAIQNSFSNSSKIRIPFSFLMLNSWSRQCCAFNSEKKRLRFWNAKTSANGIDSNCVAKSAVVTFNFITIRRKHAQKVCWLQKEGKQATNHMPFEYSIDAQLMISSFLRIFFFRIDLFFYIDMPVAVNKMPRVTREKEEHWLHRILHTIFKWLLRKNIKQTRRRDTHYWLNIFKGKKKARARVHTHTPCKYHEDDMTLVGWWVCICFFSHLFYYVCVVISANVCSPSMIWGVCLCADFVPYIPVCLSKGHKKKLRMQVTAFRFIEKKKKKKKHRIR